jgi:tripartite-type tricarboxylate transporter receptor subunit TctC
MELFPRKAGGALALCLFLCAGAALGQTYPARAIRLVVPQSPGGSTDQVARPLAKQLGEALGQPVVIDNRAGAGSVIGTDIVAKAAPDGYTLLAVAASFTISPALYKQLPYDAARDFTPITMVSAFPNILVINPSLPVSSFSELISFLKKNPGKANYSSSGIGTGTHLSMELLKHLAGIDLVHVPYKGGAPSVNALLGGEVQVTLATISTALPHVKTGRLKALAVTSAKRVRSLPDVPTLQESGVKDYEYSSWIGLLAPAKTPRAVIEKLAAAAARAARTTEMKNVLALEGAEPIGNSPDEFAAQVRTEIERWAKLVAATGIKAD